MTPRPGVLGDVSESSDMLAQLAVLIYMRSYLT
jgi:hypothetical protein